MREKFLTELKLHIGIVDANDVIEIWYFNEDICSKNKQEFMI